MRNTDTTLDLKDPEIESAWDYDIRIVKKAESVLYLAVASPSKQILRAIVLALEKVQCVVTEDDDDDDAINLRLRFRL